MSAPGSPQELSDNTSAVSAIHCRSRFMGGKNVRRKARVKPPVDFRVQGCGISSTLRTFTGRQPSTTGRSVRVILVPFERATSPTLVDWNDS